MAGKKLNKHAQRANRKANEAREEVHEADMAALRFEQLAADVGIEDDDFSKCLDCGYTIWPDGSCCCDESDEGPDDYDYDYDEAHAVRRK